MTQNDNNYEIVNVDDMMEQAREFGRDEGPFADYDAFDAFTSSARYANIVLPTLRGIVGYEDHMGAGTNTTDRMLRTADGDRVMASDLLDDAVDAFFEGAVEQ